VTLLAFAADRRAAVRRRLLLQSIDNAHSSKPAALGIFKFCKIHEFLKNI